MPGPDCVHTCIISLVPSSLARYMVHCSSVESLSSRLLRLHMYILRTLHSRSACGSQRLLVTCIAQELDTLPPNFAFFDLHNILVDGRLDADLHLHWSPYLIHEETEGIPFDFQQLALSRLVVPCLMSTYGKESLVSSSFVSVYITVRILHPDNPPFRSG
jgi:hypothetical protein